MSRTNVASVRLAGDESDRLDQLASIRGCDRSTVIRQVIAEAPLVSVRWVDPPPVPPSGDVDRDLVSRLCWRMRET